MDFIRNLSPPAAAAALKLVLPMILIGIIAIQLSDTQRLNNLIILFVIFLSAIAAGILFFDKADRESEKTDRKDSLKFKNRLKRKNNA